MHWYEAEIASFEVKDLRQPAPPSPIVFYGSSSIRLWSTLVSDFPGLPVVNRGFGGSTMTACSWFFWRAVRPLYPRCLVLYAGDNDLADGADPSEVARQLAHLVRQLDEGCGPATRLALLSVKVSPRRVHLTEAILDLNERLRSAALARPGSRYIDVASPMLKFGAPDPLLFESDGLHLNAAGYGVWTGALRRHLDFIS